VPLAGIVLVSQLHSFVGDEPGSIAAVDIASAASGEPRVRRLWPTGDATRDVGVDADRPPVGDPGCTEPPPADRFAPHGIHASPTDTPGIIRVAVVAHGFREAVELFHLIGTGDAARLVWRGCAPFAPRVSGNDVTIARDGSLIASNYQPTMGGAGGLYWMIVGGLGFDTGDVLSWGGGEGWRSIPGTAAANPNGVAVSPDGSTVFYVETGGGRIDRVPRAGIPGGKPDRAHLPGAPDNVSWSSRGTLLVASHASAGAFLRCAFSGPPCHAPWLLLEVDPATLVAKPLLESDGRAVGAVASATEVEGRYYFGAVFGDRIGVWQP